YLQWCKANKFVLMLLSDAQECCLAAATANAKQGTLNNHVWEVMPTECVIPYTYQLFCEALVEWLICTNQACCCIPIQAVDHLTFKKMIDVASHATKG
ncbi:hypothetical protein PAXRUDRAFT_98937, partial [Paxillus rubicundulus Ve08.2h10]